MEKHIMERLRAGPRQLGRSPWGRPTLSISGKGRFCLLCAEVAPAGTCRAHIPQRSWPQCEGCMVTPPSDGTQWNAFETDPGLFDGLSSCRLGQSELLKLFSPGSRSGDR